MQRRNVSAGAHVPGELALPVASLPWTGVGSWPTLWIGLCWGLSVPCLGALPVDKGLTILPAALPISVALLLGIRRLALGLFKAAGPREAGRQADHALAPLALIAPAPLTYLLPLGSLPLLLAFVAVTTSLYRMLPRVRAVYFERREDVLVAWIFGAVFVVSWIFLFQVRIVHDAFQYYGYLASVAIDGDLNLYDEIYLHNAEGFYNPFPLRSARYMGTAVFQAPFFAVGHLAAVALRAAGKPNAINGYSFPYLFFTSLAHGLFALGGLIACYRLAREWFSRRISTIAVWVSALASPLALFMYSWAGWAHPIGLLLVALFLLLWQRTRAERSLVQWAMLGCLGGAICLVRPTAAVVFVFPLLEWVAGIRGRSSPRAGRVAGPLLAATTAVMVFSPQLSLWKAISGAWLATPYREVGDKHDWLHPDLAGILFSTAQHGLLVWTPLLLFATLGLFALRQADRLVAAGSAATIGVTLYVYACWSVWWTGVGFSNRFFIEITPLFILGLAAGIRWLERSMCREWVWGLASAAVIWNLVLVLDYRSNVIPQGIPDPFRVVDEPLTFVELAASGLRAHGAEPLYWMRWFRDGFFTRRMISGFEFGDLWGVASALLGLMLITAMAWLGLRLALCGNARRLSRGRGGVVLAVLASTFALHLLVWAAARNTTRVGNLHPVRAARTAVQQSAEAVHVYPDYPLPVTAVDLLTFLIYGHDVDQNTPVAEVTVFDEADRPFTKFLLAGVDTAETSYPRAEHRTAIRHGIEGVEVVRSRLTHAYSSSFYEQLTFRSVLELPEPMVVKSLRIRYLHPVGRLVVSDVFMRDF